MKLNIKLKEKNKLKGNISILIIFVLLISGLIGILTMNFVKDMLWYTGDFYHYNKAYYYSNAWLELALTETDNAGIWFSNKVNTEDSVFVDNFECANCSLEMDVQWKTQYLSDKFWLSNECTDNNAFVLQSWWSVVLPLFTQGEFWNNVAILSDDPIEYNKDIMGYTDEFEFISDEDFDKNFTVWMFVLSGGDIQRDLLYIKSLQWRENMIRNYFDAYSDYYSGDVIFENDNYLMYLIISNVENSAVSFCINMDDINSPIGNNVIELPTMKFFVNSLATYWDKEVWLQAIYRQPIPDFLINSFNQDISVD